ncbi:MAG: signal recognition particle-docking protein FtsY [archaeon]|jgi:fused signal recognition particle receptor
MFGFLKQKLSDFGNKLKETIVKEEVKETKEKVIEKKEITQTPPKTEKAKTDSTEKETQKQEAKKVEHIEHKPTNAPKKEEKKEEIKHIETKETQKPLVKEEAKKEIEIKPAKKETEPIEKEKVVEAPKKQGLLSKLLGLGKKEEKTTTEKPTVKKKTKEELAEELERKMFAEIEEEIKKEEKIKPVKEEIVKEIEPIVTETKPKVEEIKPIKEKTPEIKPQVLDEIEEELEEEEEEVKEIVEQEEEPKEVHEEKARDIHVKTLDEDKRELKANVGVVGGLKGFLFGGIEITEKQIEDMLWELELSLIESDVEQDAATELVTQIKKRLVGSKVSAKNIDEYLQEQIKEILTEMMKTPTINILEEIKTHKPLKILILGPNGAGKTTSIAKLVHYLKKHKKTSIVAAADTFRAGAIDQIEEHAKKLEVRVIKQQYGADPAAVAFDAIKAAEAANIDVVLIDSAGRQETNKNLMEELRKIERVAKPDLKLYVGEAYVGQTLLEQVSEFSEIVGIDGFILTKIDTDAKGGTAISLLYKTKKPILFVGTGQGYDDFKEFTPEFILERIL